LNIIEKAPKSQFVSDVAVLSAGAAVAQAITILASPVLTRLYSPEAFGLFAAFFALVTSLSPAATGKYEVAMVLPKSHRLSMELFGVALWFCVALSILFLAATWLLEPQLLDWLESPNLEGWILLAPVVLMIAGLFNLGEYLANRNRQYRIIARANIIRAIIAVGINIALGFAGVGFLGLLVGTTLGLAVGFAYQVISQYALIAELDLSWSRRKLAAARRYADYPIYNASTQLLNGIMTNLPIFFMIHYFPSSMVGYFALVVRVLYAPVSLVSGAVSKVNLRKVVDLANEGQHIPQYVLKVSAGLLAMSIAPAALLILWGPQLFELVFGKAWGQAGQIACVMAFALPIRFVSSTLSTTFGATRNNRFAAIWKVTAFISTLVVLGVLADHQDPINFIIALVINDICLYIFMYYLILRAAGKPRN
jgi:O-antigen/teichoic acid export membrane protein